jgi:hypothetical protein
MNHGTSSRYELTRTSYTPCEKSYLKKGSKEPPTHPLLIAVYKDWLKQYLDWFDPDLFNYISAHAAGMKVSTFANRLASNYHHDYEMQAQIQYNHLLCTMLQSR